MCFSFSLRHTLVLLFLLLGGGTELFGQIVSQSEHSVEPDTLIEVILPDVNIYANRNVRPMTLEERRQLWRLIRDVKITYPYAKYDASTIIETYEYMETTPKMKNLTLRQGKILIKLVHRQCGMTGYELVKTFLGGFKAWTWQIFARVTGANLKSPYDPLHNPEDATIERIIHLLQQHLL